MWFLCALTSAILASFRKVNDKQLSTAVHHLHLAWMTKAAAIPILGITGLITNQLIAGHALPAVFWITFVLCVCIATPLDTAVYLQSLKHGQLSKTAPLISLWPVVMLVTGAIFLGQVPTIGAVSAVLVTVIGLYILNTKPGDRNMFRNLWLDRGTRFGLIGVATVSLNTTLGAVAVVHSSPLFFVFWGTVGSSIVQFIYAQIVAPGKFHHPHKKLIAQNGSIQAMASMLYFYAVSIGPIAYVVAVKSLSSTLSAVLGAKIFKEGLGKRKIVALGIIAIGTVLLAFEA